MVPGVSPGWMMRALRPSGSRDEQRRRFRLVMREVRGRQLVFDQAVGRCGIRYAQQRFCQHHEGKALLGGQRIFPQKILDAAKTARKPAALRADRANQAGCTRVDARFGGRVAHHLREQRSGDRLVLRRIGRGKGPQVRSGRNAPGGVHRHQASGINPALYRRGRAWCPSLLFGAACSLLEREEAGLHEMSRNWSG
jgi:hypothetical protein